MRTIFVLIFVVIVAVARVANATASRRVEELILKLHLSEKIDLMYEFLYKGFGEFNFL